MKKISTIIFAFALTSVCFSQVKDDFSDGDFTATPPWVGSTSNFIVNSAHQLQLNTTIAGQSYLSTAFQTTSLDQFEWHILVKQSFSPSGSNFGRVYLTSDNADLTKPLNGYFLQFGEAGGNDAIALFRQSGTILTSICRGTNGKIAASFVVRVKVTRDALGSWKIFTDYSGAQNLTLDASGVDITYSSSIFFGMLCKYTASNGTKFFYDDIYAGPPPADTTPHSAHTKFKDVIITEIFADPSPQIGLPAQEFIEIYNRSDSAIDLSGCKLSDGTSTATFSNQIIKPKEYWVVSGTPTAFTNKNVVALTNFPTLNNDGDAITLRDANNQTIDSVNYSLSWYHDADKQEGGWSLEIIDINNICGEEDNWTASEDPSGGTPGRQNSVFASKPDLTGPMLLSAVALSSTSFALNFSEKLEKDISAVAITIDPSLQIKSKYFKDNSLKTIIVNLADAIAPGTLYNVSVGNIADCSGNSTQSEFDRVTFALTEPADSLDIVVSEILFNPRPGGADFVEVYNNSNKFINLKNWAIGNFDGSVTNSKVITTSDFVIPPKSFIAFTTDPDLVSAQYSRAKNLFKTSLPSLPDDVGSIALVSDQHTVIDQFSYSEKMHSSLIKDDEGVSLERISFTDATSDPHNWNSASATSGFATPGYANSDARPDSKVDMNTVVIDPQIFSPAIPGKDFSKINYKFEQAGKVANIKVLDQQGRLIKVLANNETLSSEGFYRWDGDRDDGSRAAVGYYIIWFEVFDSTGDVNLYRKRVIIAK